MAGQTPHTGMAAGGMKRRGLIAGAAALVAGIAVTRTATPVAANSADDRYFAFGNTGWGFHTGNRLPGDPQLDIGGRFQGATQGVYAFGVDGTSGQGLLAQGATPGGLGVQGIGGGNGAGVLGVCNGDTGYGVNGNGNGANGTGVSGIGNGSGAGVLGGGGLYGVKGIVGNSGYGVHGTAGIGFGVYGTAPTGAGVGGDSGNIGVQGRGGGDMSSNTTGAPIGVRGSVSNTGFGVYGAAGNGSAVYGTVTGGNGATGIATTGNGVVGSSTSGTGVRGTSSSSAGVYGFSTTGYGVLATVGSGGVAAVYAFSSTPNTPAFYAVNYAAPNPPNSLAGFFIGQVYINGPLVIAGGAKSAAVPHPDGTHRLLYCMESPEAWFEDFGEGTITGGKGEVKLDPDFAAVVDTAKLHVFPVSHNETHHLAVKATSSMGFSVAVGVSSEAAARGVKASDVSGTFTYRVVAKRKDVAAPRLAKFDVPKALPPPPAPPVPLPVNKG